MFEATFIKYLRTKTITAKYLLDICDCFVFYSETLLTRMFKISLKPSIIALLLSIFHICAVLLLKLI